MVQFQGFRLIQQCISFPYWVLLKYFVDTGSIHCLLSIMQGSKHLLEAWSQLLITSILSSLNVLVLVFAVHFIEDWDVHLGLNLDSTSSY